MNINTISNFHQKPNNSSQTSISSLNSSNSSNNNQQTHNIIPTTNTLSQSTHITTWKIVTHNTQGFNDRAKQQLWHTYCIQQNIDIALITETQVQNPLSKFW